MGLPGANIAGMNTDRQSADFDFYATNPEAVKALFRVEQFSGKRFLEPCVGMGHIAEEIKREYTGAFVDCIDIVDRGYTGTVTADFLDLNTTDRYDAIITNPPYSLAKEFIEKGVSLLAPGGKIAMFLKLQFLEGEKRRELFERYPPKRIHVFRKRMATWRNGEVKDATGKNWSTTICHAWYVWEPEMAGSSPIIMWI